MRNIKFRLWDKERKAMSVDNVGLIDFGDFTIYSLKLKNGEEKSYWNLVEGEKWSNNKDAILLQYTGLKDKNDIEIYEGDILFDEHNSEYFKVIYESGSFYASYWDEIIILHEQIVCSEIKGNIYENSELLES